MGDNQTGVGTGLRTTPAYSSGMSTHTFLLSISLPPSLPPSLSPPSLSPSLLISPSNHPSPPLSLSLRPSLSPSMNITYIHRHVVSLCNSKKVTMAARSTCNGKASCNVNVKPLSELDMEVLPNQNSCGIDGKFYTKITVSFMVVTYRCQGKTLDNNSFVTSYENIVIVTLTGQFLSSLERRRCFVSLCQKFYHIHGPLSPFLNSVVHT